MKVYISIPITGQDIPAQRNLASAVAKVLAEFGYEPRNPPDGSTPRAACWSAPWPNSAAFV